MGGVEEGIYCNFSFLRGRVYLGLPIQIPNHLEVFRVSEEGRYAKYKGSETELTLRRGNIYFDQESNPRNSVKQFRLNYLLSILY